MALVELSVVEQRYQAVLEAAAGVPVTEVAARYEVSRQSVHAWIQRYDEGGLGALMDRSKRPASCPHLVSAGGGGGDLRAAAGASAADAGHSAMRRQVPVRADRSTRRHQANRITGQTLTAGPLHSPRPPAPTATNTGLSAELSRI